MPNLTAGTCDKNLQRLITQNDQSLQVDLRRCSFIDTYGMVSILCLVESAILSKRQVVVRAEPGSDISMYISRMNLGLLLAEMGAEVDGFTPVRHHDQRGNLVECRTFGTVDDFEELVDMLEERLEVNGWPWNVTTDVKEWLQEAADNLETHAGDVRGFLAAQFFRNKGRMQFSVGDAGVGIAANIAADTDCAAIAQAMEEGVTSTGDPHRGIGFTHMKAYARNLRGLLRVRSGSGAVEIRAVREGQQERQYHIPHLQGTIVAADVPVGNW